MVKHIIKFSIPNILNLLIGVVAVYILTRVFGEEEYATINIFTATITTLWSALCFGMDSSYIRFYNEPPQQEDASVLGGKLLGLVTCIFLISGIVSYVFYGEIISEKLFAIPDKAIWRAVLLAVGGQIVLRFLGIAYRMEFKSKEYGIQRVVLSLLNKFGFVVGAIFFADIISVLNTNAVCVLAFALICFFSQKGKITIPKPGSSFKGYGKVFKFALFSAPILLCVNLNVSISQQIISKKIGLGAVGVYSSASYFSGVMSALQGGFSTFWAGFMFANYKTEQERIKKVNDYVLLALILFFAFFVLGKDVIFLLIGEKYQLAKDFTPMVILANILLFATETTVYGIDIANKTYITLIGFAIYAFINCVMCFELTPIYGLRGAALASAASGVFIYFYLTFFGQKNYKSIISIKKTVTEVIMIILIAMIDFCCRGVVRTCGILAILFVAILMNLSIIREIINISGKYLADRKRRK